MDPSTNLFLATAALAAEALFGYPGGLFRAIRHPVVWMGALLGMLEAWLNRPDWTEAARRAAGTAALLILMLLTVLPMLALQRLLDTSSAGLMVLAVLAATLPAQRSLHAHVRAVADALEADGLAEGQRAVGQIVGRDPERLDEAGVVRAAIESLAENFSDGVVAPALWGALAGLPGMAGYKAANTADSMIGHRSKRHSAFGWASARFDDLVNLPASRLSALFLLAAAMLCRAHVGAAWRAVLSDAQHHRSPNAGWPEAAMAGSLGIRLAGPRVYHGVRVEDAWMGDGRAEATVADLRHALRLYRAACAVQFGLLALLWLTLRA